MSSEVEESRLVRPKTIGDVSTSLDMTNALL
jgi:hypothetical protein